ncbi:unnamed protein product [Fraxinus pennsylvanica]|uniref:Pentatricopeptide repeat-containing protein n=1 Tax=Fraxinus pennsylvanica TaxID=56036 RepID=A0AAD2A1F5_9LAMI|nr:unnamed protein product [Fraxinus pennsylvanica]
MEVDVCVPDRFTYNIIIHGVYWYCNAKRVDEAFGPLDRMKKRNVKPNDATYRFLVNGEFRSVPAHKALKLLPRWVDMEPDLPKVVYDTGLDLDETCQIFDYFLNQGIKVDFNASLALVEALYKSGREDGLCQVNQIIDGFDCFSEMIEWGVTPNAITYNVLIRSLCIAGDVSKAMKLLKKMQDDGIQPDVYSFNDLIQSFCRMNKVEKAQRLLTVTSMLSLDLHPDNFIYIAFIKDFCRSGRHHEAKELFLSREANGCIPDAYLFNSYVDALIKSDRVKEAQSIWLKYKD